MVNKWTYVKGQRGRPQLLIDGQVYFRTKDYGPITYWLCSRNKQHKCMCRLWTNRKKQIYHFTNKSHNHGDVKIKKESVCATEDIEEILGCFSKTK